MKHSGHTVTYAVRTLGPSSTIWDAIALHWPEYLMEAAELAIFMLSASLFGTLLFYAQSPVLLYLPNMLVRLILMGFAMGLTAIAIIRSPMGRRSGAHFNPVVSITFFFLGKMHHLDAVFYVIAQFLGGIFGVLIARLFIGAQLASPSVRYVVTVPGRYGVIAAFGAEWFMGWLMMTVVLSGGNHPKTARFTWLYVGSLVMLYVTAFSSVSGFSVNPARTFSSAVFAQVWTGLWVYFSAPLLGMLTAAALYVRRSGLNSILCGKIYHDLYTSCPFRCHFWQISQKEKYVSSI